MIDNPLVSICIPLYNSEKYFHETMESLLLQTYKNIEIIIVDDGSTDRSFALAKEYEKQYSHVRVYTQNNAGASSARNHAFSKSKGDYIQYFDNDDIMDPNKILFQIEALRQNNFNENIVATGKWYLLFNSIEHVSHREQVINKNYSDTLFFLKEAWENYEYIIGQAWLVPRKLNEKVGGWARWDNNISVNDDGEFFTRIAYHADKIMYVEESIVYWRQDNVKSGSKDRSYEGMRSQLITLDTYFKIVEENMDYPGLKHALAVVYSKLFLYIYPRYFMIDKQILNRLEQLGFKEPLIEFNPRYKWLVEIIGVYPALIMSNWKKNILNHFKKFRK